LHLFSDYILRLRTASPAEILYRLRQAALVRRMRHPAARRAVGPNRVELAGAESVRLRMPEILATGAGNQASATLNTEPEEIRRFEAKWAGRYFADVRQGPADPDIRAVWEPARLQGLVSMSDETAAREVLSWLRRHPFLTGPHYLSAMECGLRIPVMVCAVTANTRLPAGDREEIAAGIFRHAWWIERRLSLYASLGNHTVCEALGLVFAGALFQHGSGGRRWLKKGLSLLNQELVHQVLPDGGPMEQSLAYHRFVLDLYWLAADLIQRNRLADVSGWRERLIRGERFLKSFDFEGICFPAIGDSDDGFAVAPGLAPRRPGVPTAEPGAHIFPDAGYSVFRFDNGLLTFDHGLLGMAPLYNHGHADALSVSLACQGRPILVDPGTFCYNGAPAWRRYFKSTRAHNTVSVDGVDQALQAGGFMWRKPYPCKLLDHRADGDGMYAAAEHDGYRRLKAPVIHRRSVFVADQGVVIEDRFRGSGSHVFEIHFHLHPESTAQRQGDGWWVQNGPARVGIRIKGVDEVAAVRGQTEPILGWYAPAYGAKVPATTLRGEKRGSPDEVVFRTVIAIRQG
jgi:hypothetical protein